MQQHCECGMRASSEELTGAMLGDEAIAAGAGFDGAGAGAGLMTTVGRVSWAGVGDGGADADSSGVSGDGGSGRFAACSRTWTASCRSDAGAVPAENSGGDDAAAARGGSDWLPAPARTNSSTSDGRAFSRGRNPTCIQGTPRPPDSCHCETGTVTRPSTRNPDKVVLGVVVVFEAK